ncbi:MAG: hypothetical protein M1814_004700 [Vezdaea aestivalis]|nr:MAG: hypothetical protein M1814_004700 [Vezdaea aestivalis]
MEDTNTESHHDERSLNDHESKSIDTTSGPGIPEVHNDQNVGIVTSLGGILDADLEGLATVASEGLPHTIFTRGQKRYITFMVSWGGLFSSISANIYLPALNTLAIHLHVSSELINLTITSYMIFQALSPTIFGDFADMTGRRPAYIIAFIIYLGANIGLALQNNYAALLVLRCVQSAGSSGTIALGSGVIADIATPAERGTYMGAAFVGPLVGPAIGPILGGILSQFLGWRSIFWFLVIAAALYLMVFLITFPETGRNVVGNGSIPPQTWNVSLMHYLHLRQLAKQEDPLSRTTSHQSRLDEQSALSKQRKLRIPNPLKAIHIVFEKDVGLLLLFNSLVFVVFYDIGATLPNQFKAIYGFNDLQIGLSFLPFGIGCAIAAIINGRILDWNYRRIARAIDFPIDLKHGDNLRVFPLERARLQMCFPHLVIGILAVLSYGWTLHARANLAVPLVLQFVMGLTFVSCTNTISTILVDLYPSCPATATAANNLVRCTMGAGGTAVIQLMINAMGVGWCFSFLAFMLMAAVPLLAIMMKQGPAWREERFVRLEKADDNRKQTEKASSVARSQA